MIGKWFSLVSDVNTMLKTLIRMSDMDTRYGLLKHHSLWQIPPGDGWKMLMYIYQMFKIT